MRFQSVLLLAAALGVHAQEMVKRQNDESTSEVESSTSSAEESSTTSADEKDTTVVRTVTVTDSNVDTVTSPTTVKTTVTTTVTNTDTEIETTTITIDADTSTKTVYVTTTFILSKRALNLAPRTLAPEEAATFTIEAVPTQFPEIYGRAAPVDVAHLLDKRATITQLTTVTVDGEGDATTVFTTIRQTVVKTEEKEETTTSTVTESEAPNAKETVTVTSTITVTSTAINSESTSDPGTGGDGQNNNSGSDSSSSGSGGLSTGAKAGIGAGAGVVGLAIIAALIWFCIRKRRNPKPDHDDLMGASEVPVGGFGGGGFSDRLASHHAQPSIPSVSQHNEAAAFLAPSRTKPSPEGYRGTAMGDGRAGFAKPAPYGAAYAGAVSPATAYSQPTERSSTLNGADTLPEHPSPSPVSGTAEMANDTNNAGRWHDASAAEIDSRPAPASHGAPVYEMPGQAYR